LQQAVPGPAGWVLTWAIHAGKSGNAEEQHVSGSGLCPLRMNSEHSVLENLKVGRHSGWQSDAACAHSRVGATVNTASWQAAGSGDECTAAAAAEAK